MKTVKLIYDSPEKLADLYYATGFHAPDPYIYIEANGKKHLFLSDLEVDRGRKESKAHKVVRLAQYEEKVKAAGKNPKDTLSLLDCILKEFKAKTLTMPTSTGFFLADSLRKKGYRVEAGTYPFYPDRLIKTNDEVKKIEKSQKAVFGAMKLAETVLRKSTIKKGVLYFQGKVLTSEWLREMINIELLKRNCIVTDGTIVACGKDTVDPHNFGTGPLKPHQAIIVDIFPKSQDTLFYGDATRTFCKGKAPKELKDLYNVVKAAQEYGLKNIRAGINGKTIHENIMKLMEKRGYPTGEKNGRMQGFFHSTGHGIGLELHEAPMRIGPVDYTLKAGHVFSVEPGLYYQKIGGVRIEDLVLVTKTGCKVISGYPKKLEIV